VKVVITVFTIDSLMFLVTNGLD